jgi:hypothetical protein
MFYVSLENFSLIWRRHHCRWRAAKFKPRTFEQGDLYRAKPAMTRGLGFSCLIRRTALFSRHLQHTRGCGGSILTWSLTGLKILTYTINFCGNCTTYFLLPPGFCSLARMGCGTFGPLRSNFIKWIVQILAYMYINTWIILSTNKSYWNHSILH